MFDRWEAILDAKTELQRSLEQAIPFTDAKDRGDRVTAKASVPLAADLVGQERRIVGSDVRGAIACVITAIDGPTITARVERGEDVMFRERDVSLWIEAPRLTRWRETSCPCCGPQRFQRAGRPGRATHRRLEPSEVVPVDVESFVHADLDDPKKNAVAGAIASPDFTLVEGPPGTGKTTFIAELVCQLRKRDEANRLLLSSQTHVAVDNAVARLAKVSPGLRIVRIGRAEKIGSDATEHTVPAQLERWKNESRERGRAFLTAWAADRNIDGPAQAAYTGLKELAGLQLKEAGLKAKLEGMEHEETDLLDALTDPAAGAQDAEGLERLTGLQDDAVERRTEFTEIGAAIIDARTRLADALEMSPDDASEVREAVEAEYPVARQDIDDLERLAGIQEDWIQRFGRGGDFERALLEAADVVAGTCVGLASALGSLEVEFDAVVVDEASKATPTEALVPMIHAQELGACRRHKTATSVC